MPRCECWWLKRAAQIIESDNSPLDLSVELGWIVGTWKAANGFDSKWNDLKCHSLVPFDGGSCLLRYGKGIPEESTCQTQSTIKFPNLSKIVRKPRFLRGKNFLGSLPSYCRQTWTIQAEPHFVPMRGVQSPNQGHDAGYWMLRSWMLNAGCCEAGCWMLDAECWMLNSGCWMLDAECWMLRSWMLD